MKYCKFCEEEHLEMVTEVREVTIKGIKVKYEAEYGYCPELDELLEDGELLNKNLKKARDAYKREVHLLTAEEIVAIREKIKVSQKDFAIILGMGEATISRIETKVIQDRTTDDAIRRVNEDPLFLLEKLEGVREKLGEKKYNKIKNNLDIEEEICTYMDKIIELEYFDLRNKNLLNGNVLLNFEKILNMIIFFVNNCDKVYKTKLNKLLWYADFLNYKEENKGVSGLVYSHFPYGAVPKGINELLKCFDGIEVYEREDLDSGFICNEIKVFREFEKSIFSEKELDTLGRVAAKFKDFSNRKISIYMHEEEAYKLTADRELIKYSYAAELRDF